ncbi:sensor histidine kinase [Streptacidiphilus pinicola]|uniref:histidine kinase n=1 Tax=Streptacidiphilus pinicola TaxID=2219663 RepID=A0A2X0IDX3_9ACTN|nr:sensor histidine kinase [Streptacidiphilus pinicola]RAG81823.1 sensor histidine kinase [Streptacidiphilus pinicola]
MTAVPRPPLLSRIPPGVWTGLGQAMVTLLVILFVLNLAPNPLSIRNGTEHQGPLTVTVWIALGSLLLRRYPRTSMGLFLGLVLYTSTAADYPVEVLALQQTLPAQLALCYVCATQPRKVSTPAAVMSYATLLGYELGRVGQGMPTDRLYNILPMLLVLLLAQLIGNSVRTRRIFAAASRAQATEQAITEERLRIARELHDMVAHSIGIIAIQAGVGSRVLDSQPEEARSALQAIEATSRETLSGLRRTLVALRQADPEPGSQLAPLAPAPGLDDVEKLAATTTEAGVRVDVTWRGERRPLPGDIDLSAFRIVQEAVTNVVRHSGARCCRVSIDYGDEQLALEIVDDGRTAGAVHGPPGGPGAPAGHGSGFGITGMRERVSLLHGEFSAAPRPEGGFRVAACLPLPPGRQAERPDQAEAPASATAG